MDGVTWKVDDAETEVGLHESDYKLFAQAFQEEMAVIWHMLYYIGNYKTTPTSA